MAPQRRRLRALVLAVAALAVLIPGTAANAEPSGDEIERQIRSQANALEKVIEDYNWLTEEVKINYAAADKINADLKPLTEELEKARDRIGEIAALAYKGAPMAKLTAMFETGDTTTFVDRLLTLEQITKFENGQIAAYAELKAKADTEKARYDKLITEQNAQRQALDDKRKAINADINRLNELKRKVNYVPPKPPANAGPPPAVSGKAGVAVNFAYAQLGKPYKWAAAGPGSYDCSGLTLAAWRAAGVSLRHNARMQYNDLPKVSRAALQPGDLVFYNSLNHVGLYVGNGQIIHAPTYGDHVRLASVDVMRPYGYARPR